MIFWKNKYVDLHVHSTYSDGSDNPARLIRMAKKAGLRAIALTDHDSIDGLEEAALEAAAAGIEFIHGVEFSTKYPKTLHILGYFPNGGIRDILPILNILKEGRRERTPKMIKKLDELGYPLTMNDILKYAGSEDKVSRAHFARALCDRGYAVSIREAFHRLLGDNKPAYVDKEKLTPKQIIESINNAGGVSILAHPVLIRGKTEEVVDIIKELKGYGLMGIEAYYSENKRRDTKFFVRLAAELDLMTTGGSDYHGNYKTHIELGKGLGRLKVPYLCVEQIKKSRQ